MLAIENLACIALFMQASVQALKPIWSPGAEKLSITEIVSTCVGVLIALLAKINMLDGMIVNPPVVLEYLLYVLTGIGLGRGPSFIHDLWSKIKGSVSE